MLSFGLIGMGVAQNKLTVIIRDAATKELLAGASISVAGIPGARANEYGVVTLQNSPNGRRLISCRFIGYEEHSESLSFPVASDTLLFFLKRLQEGLDEVVISSTRSTRTIQNIPTRVELIGGEELDEKANMKPGDIRMLLSESTGIQTQQVSATSANSSIRIQGLDGRYTQILKDGFPLYAGFSGGLGLLQTPPLDLKQVEVIKGASSTLYGGGAIAGLVNLISRTPTAQRDLRFLVNRTSARGLDINGFYGQQFKAVGLTVFASRNTNGAFDPSNSGFTAVPKTRRYVFNPKLFFNLSGNTQMSLGLNTSTEERQGGDVLYIEGKGDSVHRYFEANKSRRLSTQFSLTHAFSEAAGIIVKNSISSFNRKITIPDFAFDGKQWSTYSEVAYHHDRDKMDWVGGINFYTDNFREFPSDSFAKRNYSQATAGAFVQNTVHPFCWLQLEAGLRADYVKDYGLVLLPRISSLFKISGKLSSRVGGGFGYKTPTIFTEETERIQFRSVLPVGPQTNRLEKSYGLNADVNYRTTIFEKLTVNINQLFFYSRIQHPLMLVPSGNVYQLVNHNGNTDTRGLESNIKLGYKAFKLFVGYTFVDAHLTENGNKTENPLTARHRLNNVLVYEVEDKWKLGLEAYYVSRQQLTDGTTGRAYWTSGFMAEKMWQNISVFINFENFTDTRQTKFDTIYTGTVTHPVFKDIYAPLDGFVVNGGVKVRL